VGGVKSESSLKRYSTPSLHQANPVRTGSPAPTHQRTQNLRTHPTPHLMAIVLVTCPWYAPPITATWVAVRRPLAAAAARATRSARSFDSLPLLVR